MSDAELRQVFGHGNSSANKPVNIYVLDGPGPGGASHRYQVWLGDGSKRANPVIEFQNGPIKEAGINGVTHEILLAIVADRLRAFQRGPYAHPQNAEALQHIMAALEALHARTSERMSRGVEGTMRH